MSSRSLCDEIPCYRIPPTKLCPPPSSRDAIPLPLRAHAVFMWVPTLQGVLPEDDALPTGLIFSSFMVCITIGGVLFSIMLRKVCAS